VPNRRRALGFELELEDRTMTAVETPSDMRGSPTWEIAHLFPTQGAWTDDEYLALNSNHLVELSDGVLEVLPMPTEQHQLIVAFLFEMVKAFVTLQNLGKVLFAPLRVRLWEGKFREPDIIFLLAQHAARRGNKYWRGADLVMEVVSEDDPDRDLVSKRAEYARAGITEYWILDPRDRTVTVLTLDPATADYVVGGCYVRGESARSVLLDGFSVSVTEVFSQS
jgi:Uma2 family endonuclease